MQGERSPYAVKESGKDVLQSSMSVSPSEKRREGSKVRETIYLMNGGEKGVAGPHNLKKQGIDNRMAGHSPWGRVRGECILQNQRCGDGEEKEKVKVSRDGVYAIDPIRRRRMIGASGEPRRVEERRRPV